MIQTRAAVLWDVKEPFKIEEVQLQGPSTGEVLVKMGAAGLCHSDLHIQSGDIPVGFPFLAGHEGAGVIEEVGAGVDHLAPGDHVVFSFIPACGHCRWCSTGHQNLCDLGAGILLGQQLDGTYRMQLPDGSELAQMCMLGTFSDYTVVPAISAVKIPSDVPLASAALVGCGVTTGWGSSVYAAGVAPGDAVVVYGVGGIGMAAVQGAAAAGAKYLVAVDPVEFKQQEAATFGATHAVGTHDEAWNLISELTEGVLADHAIVCTGLVEPSTIGEAFQVVRKGGQVVVTGVSSSAATSIDVPGFELTLFEKTVKGTLFGSANPHTDIPKLIGLYRAGKLKLNEMITRRYTLDEVNQGYEDMLAGRNIRGVIEFH